MQKRIGIINDKYGEFGGTEEYINSFARIFDPLGYETSVIYGVKPPGNFSNPLIREFRLPFLKERYKKTSPELDKLKDFINRIQVDIIYIHNIFDHRIITAMKRTNPGKLVWYCHDHFFYCLTELKTLSNSSCEFPLGKHCIANIREGRCIKRYPLSKDLNDLFLERKKLLEATSSFDEIIVISKYMESTLIQNKPSLEDKLNLVPRQVDIPEKIERKEENKNILYVGRLVKEKGVDHLIKALEFIDCKDVKLTIVGSGEAGYVRKCQSLAKDMKGKRKGLEIIFTGQKSHQEVFEFYKKASVVALPSLWPEPFGLVAAESLAHEVPVVAFDVGGINSIIKDGVTGLLAEPGNIRDLGEKIAHLCNDEEENRKMGKNGRKFVKLKFDPQKHIDAMLRVLS